MASFTFTIESRVGVKDVEVRHTDGVGHACLILRKKYGFDDWRIVNVAALPDGLDVYAGE